jgi:hypothetical protein
MYCCCGPFQSGNMIDRCQGMQDFCLRQNLRKLPPLNPAYEMKQTLGKGAVHQGKVICAVFAKILYPGSGESRENLGPLFLGDRDDPNAIRRTTRTLAGGCNACADEGDVVGNRLGKGHGAVLAACLAA